MVDRYITQHMLPSPYERELLDIIGEEANEIAIACSKIKRFGLGDGDPQRPGANNKIDLSRELGELLALRKLCYEAGLIDYEAEKMGYFRKFPKLAKYMQTDAPGGPLPFMPGTPEEFDRRFGIKD